MFEENCEQFPFSTRIVSVKGNWPQAAKPDIDDVYVYIYIMYNAFVYTI